MTPAAKPGPPEDAGTLGEGPIAAVLAALACDDPAGVIAALDGQIHHGRPGMSGPLRQLVGEKMAVALAAQSGKLTRWIELLASSPSPTARQVACLLLADRYASDPSGALRLAETLADDPHWEVREAAAALLGTLLDRNFNRMRARLEALRSSRSENQRRAVVLAVKYAARRDNPGRVSDLLDIVEPLLTDPTPYVRRNLGPFSIGDGLLRVDPKVTLARLREWSRSRDQMVRWNVAMAFSSGIGSFHWPAARGILERLARGPEPLVRMAVAKAMRRCRQRYTDDVEDTRRRWRNDRERAATAELIGPLCKR